MEILKEFWSIIVAVVGMAVMWGTTKQKLNQHDIEIRDIKQHQNTTDKLLNDIVTQLTELNVKMDLLMKTRRLTEGED